MDPCTAAGQEYIQYYEQNQSTTCNLDNYWKEEIRGEYCSTCLPKYENLLSSYISACGANADNSIKLNHDAIQFYKAYYCSTDSSTGEYCSQVAFRGFNYKTPYSSWDPQLCSSSCVGTIDSAIRAVATNADLMGNNNIDASLFTGNNNPLSNCAGASAAGGAAGGVGGAAGGVGGAAGGVGGVAGTTGVNGAANGVGGSATNFMGTKTNSLFSTSAFTTSDATTLSAQVCLFSIILCFILALLK